RDDVIGAQVKGSGALKRATANNHHDAHCVRAFCGVELRNDPATTQVRWRRLRDQYTRRQHQHIVDADAGLGHHIVALATERPVHFRNSFSTEIEEKDAHGEVLVGAEDEETGRGWYHFRWPI